MKLSYARMKFIYLIFSFTVSVEAYGLGQQREKERFRNSRSQVLPHTNRQQLETSSSSGWKIINKNTYSNVIQNVSQRNRHLNNRYGNENKLLSNINDVKTKEKQFINVNKSHDHVNATKQWFLQHIEKQIKLRKMQQQNNKGQQKHPVYSKSVMPPRKNQQEIHPKRMFAVTPSYKGTFHDVFPQNIIQQPVKQDTLLTQQQQFQRNVNPTIAKKNKDLLQVNRKYKTFIGSPKQSANVVAYPKNIIQHIIPSSSGNLMTDAVASQHILVPLSALTSAQAFESKIALSDTRVVPRNKIIYLASQGISLKEAQKDQLSIQPLSSTTSSTTTATSPSSTSTVRPMTTSLTTPLSTSDQQSTTPFNFDTMKQKFIERAMKKQDLEIKKLKLEIRALQREEKENVSQIENDDTQQPRRGNFSQMQNMFPYNR